MVTSGPPNEASGKPKGNTESSNPRNMNKTSRSSGGNSNSNSNGDNSGDNSDNSRFSLGNNSFGFNFDSEDGHSPSNSDAGAKSDEDASGGTTGTGTRGNNTSGGISAKTQSSSSGGANTSTASKPAAPSKSSKPQQMQSATAAMAQSGIIGAAAAIVNTSLDRNKGTGGAATNIAASSNEAGSSTDNASGTGVGTGASNQQTQTQKNGSSSSQHEAAAAATVAQLQTIAAASVADSSASASEATVSSALEGPASQRLPIVSKPGIKRKASESVNSGYKSDDEASARSQSTEGSNLKRKALSGGSENVVGATSMTMSHTHYGAVPSSSTTSTSTSVGHPAATINPGMAMSAPPPAVANMSVNASPFPAPTISMAPAVTKSSGSVDGEKPGPGGKKALNYQKRIERNEREKERSYRITHQINELRNLLSTGGVIVPKGTKNAVLTEAANYIRLLQQHQYKSEIHRQQLIQQMQLIGSGQLGPQAANAIRHVAAKNGVWSLGNFGGVPPRSAMVPTNGAQQTQAGIGASAQQQDSPTQQTDSASKQDQLLRDIEDTDYRFVFNSCAIAMAIASMGGAFIDCNQLFIQLSEYTKQEICGLTIFNMTAREDLQNAFDLISRMISPPADNAVPQTPTCVLRGNMKNRTDLGLNITLIKDEEGIAKCFCVSLISNPGSPFDEGSPMHATAALIRSRNSGMSVEPKEENMSSPAFMTG